MKIEGNAPKIKEALKKPAVYSKIRGDGTSLTFNGKHLRTVKLLRHRRRLRSLVGCLSGFFDLFNGERVEGLTVPYGETTFLIIPLKTANLEIVNTGGHQQRERHRSLRSHYMDEGYD